MTWTPQAGSLGSLGTLVENRVIWAMTKEASCIEIVTKKLSMFTGSPGALDMD